MPLVKWVFWSVAYWFVPQEKNLEAAVKRMVRTNYPYRKFKPCLMHNDAGRQWEIYFDNETDYVETRWIPVVAHIGRETGSIVGVNIYDDTLGKPKRDVVVWKRCEDGPPPDGALVIIEYRNTPEFLKVKYTSGQLPTPEGVGLKEGDTTSEL